MVQIDVICANPKEMECICNLRRLCGGVRCNLILGRWRVGSGLRISIVNGGTKFAAAICVAKGIVGSQRYAELVCKVRDGDRTISPGTETVDLVAAIARSCNAVGI